MNTTNYDMISLNETINKIFWSWLLIKINLPSKFNKCITYDWRKLFLFSPEVFWTTILHLKTCKPFCWTAHSLFSSIFQMKHIAHSLKKSGLRHFHQYFKWNTLHIPKSGLQHTKIASKPCLSKNYTIFLIFQSLRRDGITYMYIVSTL